MNSGGGDSDSDSSAGNERAQLLRRCTFSDRDCVDQRVLASAQPRDACEPAPPWPDRGYSCDFCGTWPSFVARCVRCRRWLGLADCECAVPALRRDGGRAVQTIVGEVDRDAETGGAGGEKEDKKNEKESAACADSVSDHGCVPKRNIRGACCVWCAAATPVAEDDDEQHVQTSTSEASSSLPLPPVSCGYTRGLLRRVVFVLEPRQLGAWRYNVGRRLLIALLESLQPGTVAVYAIECGACPSEWRSALALIGRFAAHPRQFLPSDCRLGSGALAPRIDIVLATHSMEPRDDADGAQTVRLELGLGESRSLRWWCRALADDVLARTAPRITAASGTTAMPVDCLYVLTCHLFRDCVRAASLRELRALADRHALTVMASDGQVRPFQQIAHFASFICAATLAPQAPPLPSTIYRFQPCVL